MGYTVNIRDGHWSNGECIAVDPKTGELRVARIIAATTAKLRDIERESRVLRLGK